MESLTAAPFNPDLTMRAQLRPPLDPEAFALFGVRYVLVDPTQWDPPTWLPDWRGPLVWEGRLGIFGALEVWENPAYEGEAFLFGETRSLAGPPGPALVSLGEGIRSVALVEENGPLLDCGGCSRAPVPLERRAPGLISAATAGTRPSLLVVAEQWDPGWHAEVDERAVETVPVDGFLIGVPVPAGSHRVELEYEIDGLGLGVPLTLTALSLVFVLLLPLPGRRR
jgi:hypothetical protein